MLEITKFLNKTILRSFAQLAIENKNGLKANGRLISVVCGFGKHRQARNRPGRFGEDAYFVAGNTRSDVIGVADGVGGWRQYGIDPGDFSSFLMNTCSRIVQQSNNFNPELPVNLLASSYKELLENKKPIFGSSTACIVVLNKENNTLYTANIGDSGFIVVRKGAVVYQSEEQTHYFNTPFQLSTPYINNILSDRPESAAQNNFAVLDGDVILVATDGVFDNVPVSLLLDTLKQVEGEKDQVKLQMTANSIALMARSLSFDNNFMSPFALAAKRNNIDTVGGKPDDITVVLATVSINNDTDTEK